MRRRRSINVWPAFADLMTVLAVVGLVTTVGVLAHRGNAESRPTGEELKAERQARKEAEQRAVRLEDRLEELQREVEQLAERSRENREACREEIKLVKQELGLNELLQNAMQRFQGLIDRMTQDELLRFDPDQSLRLGDELVLFDRNQVEPTWRPGGSRHLWKFCTRLSEELGGLEGDYPDPASLFTIHVEGHTDSSRCPGGGYDCNWYFSSLRAVHFLAWMRDENLCPGGAGWRLRPIGYADTRPIPPAAGQDPIPIRRISLRVVPDYERWISPSSTGGGE